MLNGRTLMECVASNLYTQTHLHLIAAGPHEYDLKNTPILNSTKQLSDTGEYGPLEGIVSGLQHLSQHTQHAWLASSPCDTPRMPDKWVNALLQSMHSQVNSVRPNQSIQGAYAVCRGRSHYAHAIWPVAALPYLQERMHNQQLSLRGAHSTMGSKAIELSHISDTNDFSNINKSSDLIHL